ncbi:MULTISPECIES: DUF943 family protein [Enterobacteriaceae]|uniref:DUF943 family protein n=1 Tax=Enterobacteriaceae TaxID=543 RepID=UPI000272A24C|nr:DUF943 family protein [Enterobacter sp. Ag1]EJF32369.1 hypothetical protein A936_04731 [Enterobacter sp. Ag1]
MRIFTILILVTLLGYGGYYVLGNRNAMIKGAHYNGSTAVILVDRLPFTESAKIHWWERNQNQIREQYHIPSGKAGPFLISVFAFGDGYQEEGKEDRLCFKDVKPPKNCIDKNIIMQIWRERDGSTSYDF